MKLATTAYLGSYVLSVLGNAIAAIALPLIVLQTTGSVLGAGAVAAATAIPAIVAGLLMGVVIDRINRRTSSVITDLISAAAMAALPIVDMVTGLTVGWFILFGVLGSLGDVPGLTAREALLPAIVRHGRVPAERLMGLRESLGAVAIVVGPAAAGTLMVIFDGSTVLWVTAGTSLAAALVTALIPKRIGAIVADDGTAVAASSATGWSQLREGWRVLFRSRFLIAVTMISLASVLVIGALQAIVLPVFFSQEDEAGLFGFVLSALALGTLVGGAIYALLGTRFRRRGWFLLGLAGTTVGTLLVAVLPAIWVVFAGAAVLGLFGGIYESLVGVLMIERIPESMRGRIMGTQNSMTTAAPPVGIILAAVLTEYISVSAAGLALGGLWVAAALIAATAKSLRRLDPQGPEPVMSEVRVSSGEQ